jgi:hypothetical protein
MRSLHKTIVDAAMSLKGFSNLLCDKMHWAKDIEPRPCHCRLDRPSFSSI